MSLSKRFKILMRDGFQCAYCGKKAVESELEVDHIIPVSKGGLDLEDNLVTACFECNRGKRDKILKGIKKIEISELENKAVKALTKRVYENKEISIYLSIFKTFAPHPIENFSTRSINKFRKIREQFTPDIIIESIEEACNRYLDKNSDENDYEIAVDRVGGICFNKTLGLAIDIIRKNVYKENMSTMDFINKIKRSGKDTMFIKTIKDSQNLAKDVVDLYYNI